MTRLKLFTTYLFAAFLLVGCIKEKPYECPLIQTGDVSNIDESGVVFHGKIQGLGNRPILDYGFVWNRTGKPTIEDSYIKSFGAISQIIVFDAAITSAFVKGENYHVRSYIKDEKGVTYGREVIFISLGSKSPIITKITPETAAWGDTITISGENFNSTKQENVVLFKSTPGYIISTSDSEIKVVVPTTLSIPECNLGVYSLGYSATSEMMFKLAAPDIKIFSPERGTYKDIVEIKGIGFHPTNTIVKFDTAKAVINKASFNRLTVEVPANAKHGEICIYVTTSIRTDSSDRKFYNTAHYISEFTPTTATFGDEITIRGEGFSNILGENIAKFGNSQAKIIEASSNIIKAIVPNSLNLGKSKISITVKGQNAYSSGNFILKSPVIYSFSPNYGCRGDSIIINGLNFNPDPSYNKVFLDNVEVKVERSNSIKLVATITNYALAGNHSVKVVVGDESAVLNGFTIYEPWNQRASLENLKKGWVSFSINGKGYITGTYDLSFWEYDPEKDSWRRLSNAPMNFQYMGCFATSSKGYVIDGSKLYQYDPLLDKWSLMANFPGKEKYHKEAFSINNKGYVGFGPYYSEFWEYDESSNTWSRKADFPGKLFNGTAFSINDKGYALLGYDPYLYEYDVNTDHWTQKLNLVGIVQGLGYKSTRFALSEFVCNGKGYFTCGNSDEYPYMFKDIYEYNPVDNTCIRRPDLPGMYRKYTLGFAINEKGYVGFGSDGTNNESLSDFWEFDPSKQKP